MLFRSVLLGAGPVHRGQEALRQGGRHDHVQLAAVDQHLGRDERYAGGLSVKLPGHGWSLDSEELEREPLMLYGSLASVALPTV